MTDSAGQQSASLIIDGQAAAIVPCLDIDAAEAFFAPLGYRRPTENVGAHYDYRLLVNGRGGMIHLATAPPGWLDPARNPGGLYLYAEDPDAAAAPVRDAIIEAGKAPEAKSWGMYEFSLNGPDGLLVRVGWPSALRSRPLPPSPAGQP